MTVPLLFKRSGPVLPSPSGYVSAGWRDRRVAYDDLHPGTTGDEKDRDMTRLTFCHKDKNILIPIFKGMNLALITSRTNYRRISLKQYFDLSYLCNNAARMHRKKTLITVKYLDIGQNNHLLQPTG